MKNKLSDSERNHESSLKNMEAEMTEMSKQITRLKMKGNTPRNQTTGNSVDLNSEGMLSINIKRLEEKCRLR